MSSLDLLKTKIFADGADFDGIIAGTPAFAGRLGAFGNNWDSLEECLCDLSWLGAEGKVVLVHEHVPLGSDEQRKLYADILRNAQLNGRTPLRVVLPKSAESRIG